jgi:hypothetical protein
MTPRLLSLSTQLVSTPASEGSLYDVLARPIAAGGAIGETRITKTAETVDEDASLLHEGEI